ncbi:MAG: DUF433 domain-containing protein [Deinococcota bacterium]
MVKNKLYKSDPRDLPNYSPTQAARYAGVHPATLRSWFFGRAYATRDGEVRSQPVIQPASTTPNLLSFNNLIEAFVLQSLRSTHSVPMKTVREALDVAASEYGIQRPLLRNSLEVAFGELFIKHYGRLRHLKDSQQLLLKSYFMAHATRVELDEDLLPRRYYPFSGLLPMLVGAEGAEERPIMIDPNVGFGQPTVVGSGVNTYVIAERIDAGETVDELTEDYGITVAQVHAALAFDQAA